ncbi:MAG: HEAT repeat domain-containing protein [Rhodopirellula sp.]|nr:HEAT repeat domain-containing protein [Rhodopirellula sp.]
MRVKFQTTSISTNRHTRVPERVARTVVALCVVVSIILTAVESVMASGLQRGNSAPPPDREATVTTSPSSSSVTTTKPTADQADDAEPPIEIERLLKELAPSSRQAAEAVPVLLAILRDTEADTSLRMRSSAMLARIGEPARAAVPVLIEILKQSETTILSEPAIADRQKRLSAEDTSYWVMKSLGLFDNVAADAVPSVARFLTSPATSSKLRVLAADTLGQIRTSTAIGVLTTELMKPGQKNDHDSILLRQTIIDGLALAGPLAVGSIPALVRAAEDDNVDIRRKACDALGALGPRAEGALNSLLERLILDEDHAVKDAAANALVRVGRPAIDSLVELLERGDAEIQWRAARALGQSGTMAKPVVPQLEKAFENSSLLVRIEAIDAAWKISRDSHAVATALMKILSEDDRQIRRRATGLLVELEPLPRETSVGLLQLATNGSTNEGRAAAYVIRERSRRTSQLPRDQ